MLTAAIAGLGLVLASLLWVEVVRDFYHALAHYWTPLMRLHNWHHRVFRPDLTPVSQAIYRKAQWYHDLPESLVMLSFSFLPMALAFTWQLPNSWMTWIGPVYSLTFLAGAIARGIGLPLAEELTDITHRPGDFVELPHPWLVNRSYHWRHHFDNPQAYYSGTLTLVDKLLGTALSLKGKRIAVTGASGALGQSLLKQLQTHQAKVIALTSQSQPITLDFDGHKISLETHSWRVGEEDCLSDVLSRVDILIIN